MAYIEASEDVKKAEVRLRYTGDTGDNVKIVTRRNWRSRVLRRTVGWGYSKAIDVKRV